ncbi:MAG TPA: zinc ribbon domain-containing protein [Candidatus Acidoferrum sp.]|nr:zinc ribbon domain-containing protein [Candidatus Acidoferrum sp.]
MSRFTKGLGIIPTPAWVVGWLVYFGATTPLFFYALPHDPEMGQWPRWGQALFVYGIFLLVVAYIALIGYVYADAKRRQMRYVMWTLLAIFIPDAIGIILYFILRDPLPKPCPGCGNVVKASFPFCPHCGTSLQPTCPNCGKPVDSNWSNCPHCGQRMPVAEQRTAPNHGLAT